MQQQAQETVLWLLVGAPVLAHILVPVPVGVAVAAGWVVQHAMLGLQDKL